MQLPPVRLILLRTVATVEISAVIGQAGWAAAFLGGEPRYLRAHALGAVVTVIVCLVGALVYVVLRRWAGRVNVVLALALGAAVGVQFAMGEVGARAQHIFLGVLIAMLTTALTSWTFRNPGPADATSS